MRSFIPESFAKLGTENTDANRKQYLTPKEGRQRNTFENKMHNVGKHTLHIVDSTVRGCGASERDLGKSGKAAQTR